MTETATIADDGPTAGDTCNAPDGPSHPCAADCDHQRCHAGWFARNARANGLVYCCPFEGWVSPQEAFEHSWDAYSSYRDDD